MKTAVAKAKAKAAAKGAKGKKDASPARGKKVIKTVMKGGRK